MNPRASEFPTREEPTYQVKLGWPMVVLSGGSFVAFNRILIQVWE